MPRRCHYKESLRPQAGRDQRLLSQLDPDNPFGDVPPPSLFQLEKECCEASLRDFVEAAWPVIEPATPFVPGWHIDAICAHLQAVTEGRIAKLMINEPPRHMKSTLVCVMWPAWEWIRAPHQQFLCASYAASLSIRDAVKCRRVIQSPWYQQRWGQRFALTSDQNAKERYENNKSGYRIATSVGGSATGEGGSRLIVDDAHNLEKIKSDLERGATLDWWDQVMATRENDPAKSARVVIGQRGHELDLYGYIQQKESGWTVLTLPARFELPGCETALPWRDPRTEDGQLLWPQRFSNEAITALETSLGSYGAAAQLQQRPAPRSGGIVKREWWKYYDIMPSQFDEIIQSWDMAFKDLASSDYVVGQVWARIGANKFLLEQVRKQLSFTKTIEAVKLVTDRWPQARLKLVEDKANGPAVIDTLRAQIPGLVPVPPEGGKTARAYAVSPDIESGNVFLPNPLIAPWVENYLLEWDWFPNGAHDDQVDATTQALRRLASHAATREIAPVVSLQGMSHWRSNPEGLIM